jgi:protein-disulfide isomerase
MAFRAALASRCAGEQGKYWEMRARLFANPQTLDQVAAHAVAVGVDRPRFDACMAAGRFVDQIRQDMTQAQAAGVSGTPTFMLAITDARGQLKVQRVISGAQPFANFQAQIDALLARR